MQRPIRALAILATFGLFAHGAQAQDFPKINLKVSGGNQTQNLFQKIYKPFFTEQLAARTNGAITTTFGSLEELGLRGPEVLRLLRQGVFDISEATMSYMAGEDSRFDGLDLPGVTVDIATQRKAADAFRPALAKALETKYNTKLLSMSPVAAQMFYCKGEILGLEFAARQGRSHVQSRDVTDGRRRRRFFRKRALRRSDPGDAARRRAMRGDGHFSWQYSALVGGERPPLRIADGLVDDLLRRQFEQLEEARREDADLPRTAICRDGRPHVGAGRQRHPGRRELQHRRSAPARTASRPTPR